MVKKGDKPPKLKSNPNPNSSSIDPETQQKQHLRSLAVSNSLLRRSPVAPSASLAPSSSVLKLDGRDIVKRGQRKSRFLFSFPGLLAPLSGGRVGELANLGSKNPVLYFEFPNGRMKLFGTHVYPKNKYLTLQLTKSTKGVMCEDCFESLIVFSEAWWIGSKEENPEENRLELPKDMNVNKDASPDFKGGAGDGDGDGATFEEAPSLKKSTKAYKDKTPSPSALSEDDIDANSYPSTGEYVKSLAEVTPVRQSARMSGKTLNYAESSGDDSVDADEPETKNHNDVINDERSVSRRSILNELEASIPETSRLLDNRKIEQSLSLEKEIKPKDNAANKKGSLVQTTLSTLFEKAVQKNSTSTANHFPQTKGSGTKRRKVDPNQVIEQVQVKGSKGKEVCSGRKKTGTRTVSVRKRPQVSNDETEEISSDTQDSDEDWAA